MILVDRKFHADATIRSWCDEHFLARVFPSAILVLGREE